jgi:inner membrane protein YidH
MTNQTEKSTHEVDVSTRLAIERTRVAYDRTMMSWIRTATSLITFGFTIYKYFQLQRTAAPSERLIGPREFSLILISLGLFSLVVAVWQNRQGILRLRALYPETPRSLAGALAAMIALLGLLALISVILRL